MIRTLIKNNMVSVSEKFQKYY